MANLLVTGGAGFIGSHTTLALLGAGHSVVVLDNFANSSLEALRRVASMAALSGWRECAPGRWMGNSRQSQLIVLRGDVRCPQDLDGALKAFAIEAVLHFAGLKAVGESVRHPLRYWDVNLGGSRCLLEAMERHGCRTLVFSSSATLYGFPDVVPIPETAPLRPINPYGSTKAAVEQLLKEVAGSSPGWRLACLRYFNPVGAHPSGRLGEDPHGIPCNVFPLISQVAAGRLDRLQVFGADWPTPDGTGVRDYIHVMDLAEGHLKALDLLLAEGPQQLTLNLGSGVGISVLELVRAYEAISGKTVPCDFVARRPGDSAISIADPSEAARRMGWHTRRGLAEICRDGWTWQSANPWGYGARAASVGSMGMEPLGGD